MGVYDSYIVIGLYHCLTIALYSPQLAYNLLFYVISIMLPIKNNKGLESHTIAHNR